MTKIINYSFELALGEPDKFEIEFDMEDGTGRILVAKGVGKVTFNILAIGETK